MSRCLDTGKVSIASDIKRVEMQDETVWLKQQQMADLFQTSRTDVVEHIKHIFEE